MAMMASFNAFLHPSAFQYELSTSDAAFIMLHLMLKAVAITPGANMCELVVVEADGIT